MTSGGKFAVRVAGSAAFDGLDTMPSPPTMAATPVAAAVPSLAEAADPLRRVMWEGAVASAAERQVRAPKPVRVVTRSDPRRASPVPSPRPRAEPAVTIPVAEGVEDAGWVPSLVSTAQGAVGGAWSFTSSAGRALAARVVPQLP